MQTKESKWELSSNSGRQHTTFLIREQVTIKRRKYLLAEVILTCRFWNRVDMIAGSYNDAKEYSLVLSQVLFSLSELKRLKAALTN